MKRTMIFASILTFLCHSSVYADTNQSLSISKNSNQVSVGTIVPDIIDNSNILVEVTLTTSGGESSVIYTGTLGGYANDLLDSIDFSETDAVILFNWDNNDMICIKPIEESTSGNLLINQMDNASMLNTTENSMRVSDDLSIASQIKLNGVNIGENGLRIIDNANLSCTFNISNESSTSKTFVPILATYDESGMMQNVRIVEVDVEAGDEESVQIIYQFDAENEHTGKLMMWDSVSSMIPLRATVDFTQTSGVNAYYYDLNNRLLQIDKINGQSLIYTYDNMGNLLTKRLRTEGTENE